MLKYKVCVITYYLENTQSNGNNKALLTNNKIYESKKVSFFDQNLKNKLNSKIDYSDIDEQKGLNSPKFLFRKRKSEFQYEKSESKQQNNQINYINKDNKESLNGDMLPTFTLSNPQSNVINQTSEAFSEDKEINKSIINIYKLK